jgi:molecular chaperone DnaK
MGAHGMSAGEWVLAVDLGTTRTRAAYTSPGRTEPVMVQIPPYQAAWLPSSVARDPSGAWLLGEDADRLRIGWDDMYVRNAKRLLGQPEPHYLNGHPFSILELVAQPLVHVATLARAQADHVFDRLALAAPVEFEGIRRDLLRQAGEMAGFPPSGISVTTEAEAAARAALGPAPQDGTWLLFDMGGGTLDVALFRTRAGSLQLLDTFGTDGASGYAVDSAIMEHLQTAFPIAVPASKTGDQETRQKAERRRETQLRDTAEQAKTSVTAQREGRAYLSEPPVNVTLPPDVLRKIAAAILEPALELCEAMLHENGLRWGDVTAIVCAGGSTRSPAIRELLATRAPVRDTAGSPELAVVLGLLVPPASSRIAHPKMIRPANAGGVHILRSLQHPGIVQALAFSPSGDFLATASGSSVWISNPADGTELQTISRHTDIVTALAFGPDNDLASGSTDQTIRLRTPALDNSIWEHETGTTVHSLAFSSGGSLLAWGGGDNQVHLWDPKTGTAILEPFSGHDSPVVAVAFAPDDSVLATAAGQAVRLWDPVDGTVRAVLTGHTGAVAALAFSHDSSFLITASHDRTVRVFDASLGICLRTFSSHTGSVRSVACSPGEGLVASGGDDRIVRLWRPESGEEITPLAGHGNYVLAVAFSPDGSVLASGSQDNTVGIWGLG